MSQVFNYTTPPPWAKHAVLTKRGWTDPKTGEVYVSLRNTPPEYLPDAPEVEQPEPVVNETTIEVTQLNEPEELSKDQLKAKLDELGIEYDGRLGAAKLKELLENQE